MSVEDRVARLETAEEVRDLLAAYARACDRRDPDAVGAILHPDVVLTAGGRAWTGRDAVVGFFAGQWSGDQPPQRHFVTNISLGHVAADAADATSYFLHVTAAGERSLIGRGCHRDTFARHDGVLVFRSKDIAMDLQVGLDEGWAGALAGLMR
jgi:SnoaL-like domain